MRIVTGLLAAVLLVSYLSVDGVLEHEDSIELGDGAPTPVLAAHNERLKQGIAQLQNGKTLSPAKPARHDSALELREEDAAGSQMASSATKDTSLGESVQVRQKANVGVRRRRNTQRCFQVSPERGKECGEGGGEGGEGITSTSCGQGEGGRTKT